MNTNQLNLVIGLIVGLVLASLLRPRPTTDRDDNVHVMNRPMATRRAAGL